MENEFVGFRKYYAPYEYGETWSRRAGEIRIDLLKDNQTIRQDIATMHPVAAESVQVYLDTLRVIGFVADSVWMQLPVGAEIETFAEPGIYTTVDGGFGFSGAGYDLRLRLNPSGCLQTNAGFMPPAGGSRCPDRSF